MVRWYDGKGKPHDEPYTGPMKGQHVVVPRPEPKPAEKGWVSGWLGKALAAFSEGICPNCSGSLNPEGYCFHCQIRWSADFQRNMIWANYPFPGEVF